MWRGSTRRWEWTRPLKRVERAYSIVSSPYERELEIFIELVEHGELTPLLHKLQVGDELSVRKIAKGRFTLDLKSGHRNHLLLATVTGVAPYVSYVRTLYADWKENKFPGDLRLYVDPRRQPLVGIRLSRRTRAHRQ